MKRRGHLIEMAKQSIRNIGTIVPIGTIKTTKIVLKKSLLGCLRASFCFVNTKKVAPRCGRESMKGHQTQRGIFYFESCVCQKKEQKTHSPHTQNIIKSKRKRKINDVFGNNLYICMIYPRKEFLYKDVIPSLTERSQAQNYDN